MAGAGHNEPAEADRHIKPCAICGHKDARLRFNRFGYPIVMCPHCALSYLDYRMTSEAAAEFYSTEYFTGGDDRKGYLDYVGDRQHLRMSFRRKLEQLEQIRRPGAILDVGCAAGFFLEEARDKGWQVYGQEVSEYAAAAARESLGDTIVTGDIDAVELPPQSLDVVTMWDVIEHLDDPMHVLGRVRGWLKDDGIFAFCTGNVDSWLARLQGRRSRIYAPPQHLYFYSAKSVELLLEKAGFRILRRTIDSKTMSLAYFFFIVGHINSNPVTRFLDHRVGRSALGRRSMTIPLFDNMKVYAVKA